MRPDLRRRGSGLGRRLGLGLGVAAAAMAAAALAQDRPESLLPEGFDEPVAATPDPATPATPAPPTGATGAEPRGPSERATGAAATPDPLDAIDLALLDGALEPARQADLPASSRRDPARAGLFEASDAGFEANGWGRAGGGFLSILLRRMDTPLASRWAHIGLRDLMLARLAPPHGVHPVEWAAERGWLLLRMGEADGARLLLASVDRDDATAKFAQVALQSALATGDPAAFCGIGQPLDRIEPRAAPLVSAICASLSGDSEAAASDVERVRRRGQVGGVDLALAGKLVGAAADSNRSVAIDWQPVDHLTSWRFGLATAAGMAPPEPLMARAAPRVRAWMARAPMLAPAAREAGAREAAALGVWSNAALVDFYAQLYDSTDPDALGETTAWQLRLAYVGEDLDTRLEAMRALWRRAGPGRDREAARVMLARAASRVAPSAALSGDAPDLVASMLAGGFDRQAARWAAVANDLDDEDGDRLWAMLALAAPAGVQIDRSVERVTGFIERDESRERHRSRLLVGGLAGLGLLTPAEAGELDRRFALRLAGTTLWTRLIDGASARRQGATAMVLAASALQGRSFDKVEGMYLFHSVNALRRTGQEYRARMIAAEALART